MTMSYSRTLISCLICAAGIALSGPAQAQSYPSKPVLIILPLGAGSASDVAVRTLSDRLSTALKQQFLVENQPGAAGLIGTERAAKANPDGYTLTALNSSIMTTLPHVYAKVGYDPFKSFTPISMLVTIPTVLVVHPSLPARSVKELIALAKSKPGDILYASGGVGSPQHLAMEMFKNVARVDMVHVPYKGAPAATLDVVGGHVQALFNGLSAPLPHIRSGRLRALAMAGARRSSLLPDVPTVAEAGVPGYVYEQWLAFLAPARTPAEIVGRLNAETAKIMAAPDVRELLTKQALDVQGTAPEEVTKALNAEYPRMATIIKQLGIKPE
jgi:tripartite-type tricarboxylate transporter receptor subunit TctC